jgi:hypothetical protein
VPRVAFPVTPERIGARVMFGAIHLDDQAVAEQKVHPRAGKFSLDAELKPCGSRAHPENRLDAALGSRITLCKERSAASAQMPVNLG